MKLVNFFLLACIALAACSEPNGPDPIADREPEKTEIDDAPKPLPLRNLRVAQQRNSKNAVGGFLDVMNQALSDDPSLIAARLQVDQTQGAARDTREWFRPSLSTSVSTVSGSPAASLEVRQELFDFGKRAKRSAALLARADAEKVELDGLRLDLAAQMLRHMVEGQEARALISLNTRRRASFQSAFERAKKLLALGMVTGSDLSLAQVKVQAASRDLESARIALSRAERGWQRITLGKAALPSAVTAGKLLVAFDLKALQAAQQQARNNNLDIRIANASLRRARFEYDAELAQSRPTINVVGSTRLDDNFTGDRSNVGLSLDYTILNRDRDQQLRQVKDSLVIREAQLTELQRGLNFDVGDLWAEISEDRRLASIDQANLAALQNRVEVLEAQMPLGLTPFEQVIQAKNELFQTGTSAIRNRFSAERNAAKLLLITGVIVGQ